MKKLSEFPDSLTSLRAAKLTRANKGPEVLSCVSPSSPTQLQTREATQETHY